MKIKNLRFKTYATLLVVATFLIIVAFITGNKSKVVRSSTSYYEAENEYLMSLRVNPKTGTVTPADYNKALREVERYRSNHNTREENFNWQSSGPDNFAGRTRAILKDANSEYIYIGSANGGLWRLKEGDLVWNSIPGVTSNLNISCLHQSANGTIYVGTGEGFYSEEFNMLPGFKGRGIFKSDNGVDFTSITSTIPADNAQNDAEWFYINSISSTSNNLFVGTNTGLKVSNLNGDSWAIAKSDGQDLVGNCSNVVSNNQGAVVAFVDSLAYISVNGDPNNFTCISKRVGTNGDPVEFPNMLPKEGIGSIVFAFSPTNPDYLYAVTINKYDDPKTKDFDERGTLEGIYRAIKQDGKWNNWTLIGPGGSNHMFYVFKSNGMYSCSLLVDPENENKIYVGGMDLWEGEFVSSEFNLYRWTQLTTYENSYSKAYTPQNHFSYYKNGNNILIACENGVYSFNTIQSKSTQFNINLSTSQFYTVSSNYKGDVVGGSQGNGTVFIEKESSLTGKSGINAHIYLGATTGSDYTSNNIGGYAHNSMIYPVGNIVSINGRDDLKYENIAAYADFKGVQPLIIYRFDDQVPQSISWWYEGNKIIKPIEDSASYITPSILWENFNYEYSVDSVTFYAEENYNAGETIIAHSKNARYPIEYVLSSPLAAGDSLRIHDKVASRFFVGVNGSILMTKEVSNFNHNFKNDNPWFTISSSKLNGVSGTPQCMGLSDDANYLFVGTTDGNLYRISNIAYAHDSQTANVGYDLYTTTAPTVNPYCVISTSLVNTFEGRIITSISVNPTNPEMVVVTLGNYGFDDYIYISTNALSENPTFSKVDIMAKAPVYTSSFIQGTDISDNVLLIGNDFGIWKTNDISNRNTEWTEEITNLGEVPVFMIKQQNVQTVDNKPIYVDDKPEYIKNYRGIYVATFGKGLFECTDLVKNDNEIYGIEDPTHNESSIEIYPNPVRDFATINFETEANLPVFINIYDITGKLVKTTSKTSLDGKVSFNINVSEFQAGTYIISAVSGNKKDVSKFVVIK